MGPISDIGFSVCGWVRFEALGWRGRGGGSSTQGAGQGAGRWQGRQAEAAGAAGQA